MYWEPYCVALGLLCFVFPPVLKTASALKLVPGSIIIQCNYQTINPNPDFEVMVPSRQMRYFWASGAAKEGEGRFCEFLHLWRILVTSYYLSWSIRPGILAAQGIAKKEYLSMNAEPKEHYSSGLVTKEKHCQEHAERLDQASRLLSKWLIFGHVVQNFKTRLQSKSPKGPKVLYNIRPKNNRISARIIWLNACVSWSLPSVS